MPVPLVFVDVLRKWVAQCSKKTTWDMFSSMEKQVKWAEFVFLWYNTKCVQMSAGHWERGHIPEGIASFQDLDHNAAFCASK